MGLIRWGSWGGLLMDDGSPPSDGLIITGG